MTREKVDYNIEFGHIYMDEIPNEEHRKSALLAKEIIKLIELEGKTYVTTILIDDYNPLKQILDIKKFIDEIQNLGIKPDFIIKESILAEHKDIMLEEMNGKFKRMYSRYVKKNNKCPCSFLVSIWYLLRLGYLDDSKIRTTNTNKSFQSKKIITILPNKYSDTEDKAISIIKNTKFSNIVDDIEYHFF